MEGRGGGQEKKAFLSSEKQTLFSFHSKQVNLNIRYTFELPPADVCRRCIGGI